MRATHQHRPIEGTGTTTGNLHHEVAIYDALPPGIRRAVREFPYPISCMQIADAFMARLQREPFASIEAHSGALERIIDSQAPDMIRKAYAEFGFDPSPSMLHPLPKPKRTLRR